MKKKKREKGSIIWLIIFLGAIVFGLAWLVGYNRHLKIINSLNEEVQRLNQEIEGFKRSKEGEIRKLEEAISPSETTPSAELESKTTTSSGESQ